MLKVENLTVRAGELTIVDDVSFELTEGQWLMVVGPNGAGKSTVVNAVSQGIPYHGNVSFQGQDIARYKPVELARNIGVLAQNNFVGYSFTVGEIVKLGRYAYAKGVLATTDDEDARMIDEALKATGMRPFMDQSALTLSGGELQRTFLAQVFAQNPKLLILDEPTNHLDLVYQRQVFDLIRKWLQHPGRAVVSVVHDLSLARSYGSHALLMNKGKQVALGSLEEVLTRERLAEVYTIDVYQWMNDMLSQWREDV